MRMFVFLALGLALMASNARAHTLPITTGVDPESFIEHTKRVIEAMNDLGAPLAVEDLRALEAALDLPDDEKRSATIQGVLDHYCLLLVTIDPQSRVEVAPGISRPELIEHGWRQFLVKVVNEGGSTASLRIESPQARRLHGSPAAEIA